MRAISWQASAVRWFAAITACASVWVVTALIWPGSPLGGLVDLASIHEIRATAAAASLPLDAINRQTARTETVSALRSDPANPTSWLRLAYLDVADDGRLGAEGLNALRRSYSAAPLGPDNSSWRLPFAFEHWQELDSPLRRQVLEELNVALAASEDYDQLPQSIGNSAGRLAATLTVRPVALKRAEARRRKWRQAHLAPPRQY